MDRPAPTQVLQSSYYWQTPVSISTVGLVVCVSLLAHSAPDGWLTVAITLVLLWGAFIAVVWIRTRAEMEFSGPMLRVRRIRQRDTIDARQLTSVREYLTGSGPSYWVRVAGDSRRHHVPTALMRDGHSSFFGWLLTYAPQAELDGRSRRTRDRLQWQGKVI